MTVGYREGISIGIIAFYVPILAIAIFLAVKHGFGRSAGWFFLIILSLARIIGASMQIATVHDPTNISLYIGSAILTNIGYSPLLLATLGLMSRLVDSINRNKRTLINTQIIKLIELVIIVALILGIVGGTQAGDNYSTTGTFRLTDLNKAGTALYIVSVVLLIVFIAVISFDTPHAERGEHRIFYAILAAMPFIIARLVYSCMSTFTHNKNFNLITGSPTALLCLALLEELIVVIIYEMVGLTLKKIEPVPVSSRDSSRPMQGGYQGQGEPKKENLALRIFKHTIIGRIVFAFIPDKNQHDRDVEMQSAQYHK